MTLNFKQPGTWNA